jgi:hypothetical protein
MLYVLKSDARRRPSSCVRNRKDGPLRKKEPGSSRRECGEKRSGCSGRRRRGRGRGRRGPWRRNGSSGYTLKKSRPPDYGGKTREPAVGMVPIQAH